MRLTSLVIVFAIALGLSVGLTAEEGVWREITGPPELDLPRDHGAHPGTRTEWWYVTGLVDDAGGRRFGFQITFFRQGLAAGDPEPGSSIFRVR